MASSIIFHPQTQQKIEDHWDQLSPQAQMFIKSLEQQASAYQKLALRAAVENDRCNPPVFIKSLKYKITRSKGKSLERIDNVDAEKTLNEIYKELESL
jgi:signal recognition particle subunit SEC65